MRIKTGTLIALLVLTAGSLEAASRYWVGSSNWNNAANWSATSGGAGGAGIPGSSDAAIFDGQGVGDCTLDAAVTISSLTISTSSTGGYPGTVYFNGNALAISGSFTQNNGSVAAGTSSIIVGGDWSELGGIFNPGTSTVTFSGATPSLVGSTTFYNLVYAVAGGTITLPANSTQTVSGLLTLSGGAGNPILLRSSTPGTWVWLSVSGSNLVSYVDVKDCNASGGSMIAAGTPSVDSGHNVNWSFGGWTSIWTGPSTNFDYSLAAGDFNGDGRIDLGVGGVLTKAQVYSNNGNGTFTSVWNTSNAAITVQALAWGDYDGDGQLDLF